MEVLNYVAPMGETEAARVEPYQVVYDAAHFRALHSPYPFNQEHAEDIAQEVVAQFAAADQSAIENPAAWANRVAGRVAARMWEKQKLDDPEAGEAAPESATEMRKQGRRDLQLFLQDGQPASRGGLMRQQADLLVGELNERELELLRAVADGMSHADIAVRMGYASADSVKTTLARIRRKVLAAAGSAGIDINWAEHPRPY